MLIARHYKQNNIAEYLLYMWQVEDIIRSHNFDLQAIDGFIVQKHDLDEDTKGEMKMWYQNLIDQMMQQGISEKGHLKELNALVDELQNLHGLMLSKVQDQKYLEVYTHAKPNIDSLKKRSEADVQSEIALCFNGLYGQLMLKLSNQHISAETSAAMETISKLVAYLAAYYKKWKANEIPELG